MLAVDEQQKNQKVVRSAVRTMQSVEGAMLQEKEHGPGFIATMQAGLKLAHAGAVIGRELKVEGFKELAKGLGALNDIAAHAQEDPKGPGLQSAKVQGLARATAASSDQNLSQVAAFINTLTAN